MFWFPNVLWVLGTCHVSVGFSVCRKRKNTHCCSDTPASISSDLTRISFSLWTDICMWAQLTTSSASEISIGGTNLLDAVAEALTSIQLTFKKFLLLRTDLTKLQLLLDSHQEHFLGSVHESWLAEDLKEQWKKECLTFRYHKLWIEVQTPHFNQFLPHVEKMWIYSRRPLKSVAVCIDCVFISVVELQMYLYFDLLLLTREIRWNELCVLWTIKRLCVIMQ